MIMHCLGKLCNFKFCSLSNQKNENNNKNNAKVFNITKIVTANIRNDMIFDLFLFTSKENTSNCVLKDFTVSG